MREGGVGGGGGGRNCVTTAVVPKSAMTLIAITMTLMSALAVILIMPDIPDAFNRH